MNVIYLISCTNCNEQNIRSAANFKKHFKIHKIERCEVARHFTNKCWDPQNPHAFSKLNKLV